MAGKAQFPAVSIDGIARTFGLGETGVGHVLIIPRGFQGDPLSLGGTIEKACGGKGLDASRLSERFQGDAVCKRCAAWLLTTGGRDGVESARADYPGTDIAAPVGTDGSGEESAPVKVKAPRKRKAKGADKRENSAPTLPGIDAVTGVTGKTYAEMVAETAAYYANGGKPSPEILALPDPHAVRKVWDVADGSGPDSGILVCEFRGEIDPERVNMERTHGKCPECSAYIPLGPSEDPDAPDKIGKHNVGGVATPAGKGLTSRSMDTVEHGTTPGDPADADKRRAAETRCGESRKVRKGATGGSVTCDTPKGCGRRGVELKRVERKSGEAWIMAIHTVPGESFKRSGSDGKGERRVTPRGTGADAGKGARDHGSVNGSANVGRQNMAPVQPGGWLGKAGTMSLPAMVRPGVDPEVTGKVCPLEECGGQTVEIAHKGMTRSARRRHSIKVGAVLRERAAKREAARAAEIERGEAIPVAERRERRKAASVGSFAEGVNAHTGHVTHAVRPAKGETSGKGKARKARAGK